jgi:hypothetical protein
VFGPAWEDVAALCHAARTGADPGRVDVRVRWADFATRSVAQEADAVVKLHQAGLVPAGFALRKLGLPDDEVEAIRAERAEEAAQAAVAETLARMRLAEQLEAKGLSPTAALAGAGLFAAATEQRADQQQITTGTK